MEQENKTWRMLSPGETIRVGDDYGGTVGHKVKWRPTENHGYPVGRGERYRRPVTPEVSGREDYPNVVQPDAEWRLLCVGDVLQEGDEFLNLGARPVTWETSTSGRAIRNEEWTFYRRRVVPSDGWRMLAEGEVIREGDEYGGNGRGEWNWTPTNNPTFTVRRGERYRRRVGHSSVVSAGDGWRLLNVGDILKDGDEYAIEDEKRGFRWSPVKSIGMKIQSDHCSVFRRRVEKQEPSEGVEKQDPILVRSDNEGWRILHEGEVICEGDEFKSLGEWWPANSIGITVIRGSQYRRRVSFRSQIRLATKLLQDVEKDFTNGVVLTEEEIEWLNNIRKLPWNIVQSKDIPGGILARIGRVIRQDSP